MLHIFGALLIFGLMVMGEKNDQNPAVKDDMVEAVNDGLSFQILMNQLFAACHGNSRNHDCSYTGLTRPS